MNDHGFSRACPTGNIMTTEKCWPKEDSQAVVNQEKFPVLYLGQHGNIHLVNGPDHSTEAYDPDRHIIICLDKLHARKGTRIPKGLL